MPVLTKEDFKWVYRAVVHSRDEALSFSHTRNVGFGRRQRPGLRHSVGNSTRGIQCQIQALAKCNVPEIVKLGAIKPVEFEIEGMHYLAYSEEFVDGTDLWKLIRASEDKPPLSELTTLFICLLRCIQELWRHGYVHRDIKPGNVMKTTNPDRPFILLDLGIAFAVNETSLTFRPEERQCTRRYLAPEMLHPDFREHLDYRTDLYTTGMTVYEYAARNHPLAAKGTDDTVTTVIARIATVADPAT